MFRYMNIRVVTISLTAALLFMGTTAMAKPVVSVSLEATKEVTVFRNGVKQTGIAPADSVSAGETVTYTITYTNTGNEAAFNAVIDYPVPNNMSYIDNSAAGNNSEILFSIDGGKTYRKPSLLSYQTKQSNGKGETLTARPEEYTHIRWIVKSVAAGASGTVKCQLKVK